MSENPAELGALFQGVMEPVSFDDAVSEECDDHIFFYPTEFAILVFFPFPDGYTGVTTARQVIHFTDLAGGSQIMDHVLRSVSP